MTPLDTAEETRASAARELRVIIALTVLVAATRLLAMSHSVWDWDEALFCSALNDYDVAAHHPHPPGFPLFVGMGKLVHLLIKDEFHALRALNTFFSMLLFPALFSFARSLRFPFVNAVGAALLFVFLPNVWYFGGTAFSDIPAVVFLLLGGALLLRNERRASYVLGCALFAACMLIRPQNVLLICPWAVASWRRLKLGRFVDVAAGSLLIVVLVLGGYYGAARATGVKKYLDVTRAHQKYVATVDGSLNPTRPPLSRVLRDFAADPFEAGAPSTVLFFLAVLGLLSLQRRDLIVAATFLPNFLLAWLMLSVTGVSRLSLGYMPMHALLAADGMALLGLGIARLFSTDRARAQTITVACAVALVAGRYISWILPSLRELRTHDSPPVQAMRWIQQHVPPATGRIYVHGSMRPFSDYFLTGYDRVLVNDKAEPATLPERKDTYFTADRASSNRHSINFYRKHRRLWALSHRRYFESEVCVTGGWPRYLEGWYAEEEDGAVNWRWMSRHSKMQLQPLGKSSELSFKLIAPLDSEPAPPTVTVKFDGQVVDRFVMQEAETERHYVVPSGAAAPDELVLDVSSAVNLSRLHKADDDRDLGLRLQEISWRPAPPAPSAPQR